MEENTSLFTDDFDITSQEEIRSTAKWTRLLGILLLIVIGITVIMFLTLGTVLVQQFFSEFDSEGAGSILGLVIAVLVIVGGIVGFMAFLLFRGGKRILTAINTRDQAVLVQGLNDIKIYFGIFGVFTVLSFILNLFNYL